LSGRRSRGHVEYADAFVLEHEVKIGARAEIGEHGVPDSMLLGVELVGPDDEGREAGLSSEQPERHGIRQASNERETSRRRGRVVAAVAVRGRRWKIVR
jgi:hypothetical protein